MSAPDVAKVRNLLDTLRAVLNSPEALDPVNAVKGKSKEDRGYASGKKRLADARRWIDDAEHTLRNGGDDAQKQRLVGEIERVHAYVMYLGDLRDITLDGAGPGIEAWRIVKLTSRTYRHLTGPDWHREKGMPWPQWTLLEDATA